MPYPYDIILQDQVSGGSTSASLILARDPDTGVPLFEETRQQTFGDRQVVGPVEYANLDPQADLVWSQDDWSGGALQARYDPARLNTYASADGVDARWPGILALGMLQSGQMNQIAATNWDAYSLGASIINTELWTETGGGVGSGDALIVSGTGNPNDPPGGAHSGTNYLRLAWTNVTSDYTVSWTIPQAVVDAHLAGRNINVVGYLHHSGTNHAIQLRVSGAATGNSASINSTADWTYAATGASLISSGNALTIVIRTDFGTGGQSSLDFYLDDLAIIISSNDESVGVAEARGSWYQAVGPTILRFNATYQYWELVGGEINGAAATDIISYNDRVFVGYGTAQSFMYGLGDDVTITGTGIAFVDSNPDTITDTGNGFLTAGFKAGDFIRVSGSTGGTNDADFTINSVTAGTITLIAANALTAQAAGPSVTIITRFGESTRTDPDDKVGYMCVVDDELWASESSYQVSSFGTGATDPGTNATTATARAAPNSIGHQSTSITALYSFNDGVVVGKEDGLYVRRVERDSGAATYSFQFVNLTNEFITDPSTENFAQGVDWHGWLYLTAARQSLFRYPGSMIEPQDISGILFAPRLTDFGGRVRALAADATQLWLLVDVPTADTSATKETWLISVRQDSKGDFVVHTVERVDIGIINTLAVGGTRLFGAGRLRQTDLGNYVISMRSWTLPDKTVIPALDDTPAINLSGTFTTYVMDWKMPDEQKAFLRFTAFVDPANMDTEHTILVAFRVDDASAWTTLGTLNTASTAIQTLYFQDISGPLTNAVGRAIQFRFTFSTDDTVSPKMYAFALHGLLRSRRIRRWKMAFLVGQDGGVLLNNGAYDPVSKAAVLSSLDTLETQTYPIYFQHDIDEDGTANTAYGTIVPGSLRRRAQEESAEHRQLGLEVWEIELAEALVAA